MTEIKKMPLLETEASIISSSAEQDNDNTSGEHELLSAGIKPPNRVLGPSLGNLGMAPSRKTIILLPVRLSHVRLLGVFRFVRNSGS